MKLITRSTTEKKKSTGTETRLRSLRELTQRPLILTKKRFVSPTSTRFSTERRPRPDTTLSSMTMSEQSRRPATELNLRSELTPSMKSSTRKSPPLRLVKFQSSPTRLLTEMRRLSPTTSSTRPALEMFQSKEKLLDTSPMTLEMVSNQTQKLLSQLRNLLPVKLLLMLQQPLLPKLEPMLKERELS